MSPKLPELVKLQHCCHKAVEVPVVTYVSTAAQSDDQQQQRPKATHQSRGGEALSPAATASSSPHARPCRSRRGERTNLQKTRRRRRRRIGVRAFSLLLLLPHSSLLPLLLGCAGALKHSCSAKCRAEAAASQRLEAKKVRVSPTTLLLFPGRNPQTT